MTHTYGHVLGFKNYLLDESQAELAAWVESDNVLLDLLEGASRDVDGWCARSEYGSGFGPRIGTNTYDHHGDSSLLLDDDLLGATAISVVSTSGTAALTAGTDYVLRPNGGPPYTEVVFIGTVPGCGIGNVTAAGTFGYSVETSPLGTGGTLTSSATSIVLTGGTASAGMTLLVDTEQLYVTTSGATATVVRGVNGTTAATHAAGAAVAYFRYDRSVTRATYQLVGRDSRAFQAGVTGDFGGGNLPVVGNRDNRLAILRSLQRLRRYAAK